jgi:Tol biopolymer transport system component
LVKPDGAQAHIFLNLDGINYSNISWSPDSQKLVYSRYTLEDKGKEEIWMADIHTGQQTRLISDASMPVILP